MRRLVGNVPALKPAAEPGFQVAPRRIPVRAVDAPGAAAQAGRSNPLIDRIFVLSSFVIIYMSAIGFNLFTQGQATNLSTGQGNALQQYIYVMLLGVVVLATVAISGPRALFALPWPIALVLLWCWISVGWAIEPDIALRRIMLTTMIAWIIFRSVNAIGVEKPIMSARNVLTLTLLVNYLFVAFSSRGIHHGLDETGYALEGAWKGVTGHKNFAGAVCSFTILMFLFDTRQVNRLLQYLVIAGSVFFLYKSQSKTSFGILLVALSVGYGLRYYNPAYRLLAICGGLVLVAMAAMYVRANWYTVTHPWFMPTDFTGRGQIWNVLFGYIKGHWLLGSGFGSYWNIGFQSPAYQYVHKWQLWIAGIGSGHNGYFDLLATTGVPGLALALLALVLVPYYRLISSRHVGPSRRALLGAMLTFCCGHNLTETSMLDRDSLVNVFVLLTTALIYRATRADRPALSDRSVVAPPRDAGPLPSRVVERPLSRMPVAAPRRAAS